MGLCHFATARNFRLRRRCVCYLCFHFVVVFDLQNYEELSDFHKIFLIHWCSRPAKQAGQNAILI